MPETRRTSLFISQLVGRPVSGAAGERLGSLRDVVVGLEEAGHPLVRGLVVRAEKRDRFVSMRDVESLDANSAQLRLTALPEGEFERRAGEVLLEHDILDRQLVDLNGVRVVRVNDAELK
ncbi:MAG TPA: PRC-barrel domain-containing protein, partial [Chloroflexota bacterium]